MSNFKAEADGAGMLKVQSMNTKYSTSCYCWMLLPIHCSILVQQKSLQCAGCLLHEPSLVTLGAFHLVKISRISGSAVNGTRLVGSSHWKIPRESGKSKKVGPFSRLEFPNGMSCSIYVSRSLYQFQVHGRAPRRTGVYDQMEQLFTNRKFHFFSHRNFRVFFLNGKHPLAPTSLLWLSGRAFLPVTRRSWVQLLFGEYLNFFRSRLYH